MKITDKSYISLPTISLGIFIIISASFMTQLWRLASRVFGENNIKLVWVFVIFLVGTIIILYIVRQHFKSLRLIAGIIILVLSFWYAWRQPYFVKRIHVLEYTILGLLAMKDLMHFPEIKIPKKILFSILFILIIALLDEGFQKLLPYRYGTIKDIVTNLVGGSAGILLCILIKLKRT